MRHALLFGASGQIGQPLLQRLLDDGWRITALSRNVQPQHTARLTWLRGELADMPALPARVDAVLSCGPLDAFAQWYAQPGIDTPRVIAFGSTSVAVKRNSPDAFERDLAIRLLDGEDAVFATARARGAAATVLRPTLVYGAGRDATLTRIAQLASRWGRFPLPRGATGLRQPVHVDDLAAAAHACIDNVASQGQAYDLPGGETLPYNEMVARVLSSLQPSPPLLTLPPALFALAVRLARIGGQLSGSTGGVHPAAVQRLRDDLVFDATPARRDFGYATRRFAPDAAMFAAPDP